MFKDSGSGETDASTTRHIPSILQKCRLPWSSACVCHMAARYATIASSKILGKAVPWSWVRDSDSLPPATAGSRARPFGSAFQYRRTSQHTGRLRFRCRRRDSEPVECASETSWSARNLSRITARAGFRAEHHRSDLRHGTRHHVTVPAAEQTNEPHDGQRSEGARGDRRNEKQDAGHWRCHCTLQRRLLRSSSCLQRQMQQIRLDLRASPTSGQEQEDTKYRSMQVILLLHRLTIVVAQPPGRRARHDDS